MPQAVNPSILQMLENYSGKPIRVVIDRHFGFEGTLRSVSSTPPGIWLSNAEAIVVRTTLANPLPQVVHREERSELFINLASVQRIEILH